MRHHYEITVSEAGTAPRSAADPASDPAAQPPIRFDFASHDDLAAIVARVADKQLFDANDSKAFCVGLKLLGGVMLAHRDHDLFKDFAPAFGSLMKTLKAR